MSMPIISDSYYCIDYWEGSLDCSQEGSWRRGWERIDRKDCSVYNWGCIAVRIVARQAVHTVEMPFDRMPTREFLLDFTKLI